jgi:hypothetical protein
LELSSRDIDFNFWAVRALEVATELPGLLPHLAVVSARAAGFAKDAGLGEEETAVVRIHDLGKTPSFVNTGFHPLDGAALAAREGAPRVAALVAHHTGARYEAAILDIAIPYEWQPSISHEALMFADLTTSVNGTVVGLDARRADIESRYTADSPAVSSLHRLWPEALAAADFFNPLSS